MSPKLDFFDEQSEQSKVKAKLVTDYFNAWSRVMRNHWRGPIGYIDLFCGPGRYKDGNKSVPMILLEKIAEDSTLLPRMLFVFNDANPENTANLKSEVEKLPYGTEMLKRIEFTNRIIDKAYPSSINIHPNIPILSFVDPWGYKGLTMELIELLIRNKGSECIFFFNYNRINMAMSSNTYFDEHLEGIFGKEHTAVLKQEMLPLSAEHREQVLLNALISTLKNRSGYYVLPFKFYCQKIARTSHFIIFVTKHSAGYKIMKEIMYSNSAKDVDGVANFSFKDGYNFGSQPEQLSIFSRPLDELCIALETNNSGKRIPVKQLCDCVMLDTTNNFVSQNVKDALRRLEEKGKVKIIGRKKKYQNGKVTMPDDATVFFANKE